MEDATVPRSAAACRAAPLLPASRVAARHNLPLPRRAFSASVAAAPASRGLFAARQAADGDSVETAPETVPIEKRFCPFPSGMDINKIREILPHRLQ